MSHRIESWWKYNPILQKPRSLDPVRPWAWFWYYGPDPAAGVSYGQFHDTKFNFDIVTKKPEAPNVVYSPASGEPMDYVSDVSFAELSDMLSKTTSHVISTQAKCESCVADLVSDMDLSKPDEVFCPGCGDKVVVTEALSNQVKDKQTMGRKVMSAKEKRVQSLKTRIRANIMKQRQELEKEAKKSRVVARKRRRTIKAEEEEMISLDDIMEAVEIEKDAECGEEEAEMYMEEEVLEEDAAMEVEPVLDEDAFMEDEGDEGDDEAEADAEEFVEVVEVAPVDEMVEDVEEAEEDGDDEGEKDEYISLDMIAAMVSKKAKADKVKARRKAKVAASKKRKRKVKADEDYVDEAVEDSVPMEEEAIEEEEALMGGDPVAQEEIEDAASMEEGDEGAEDEASMEEDGSNAPEPDMVSEENPDAAGEPGASEAMRFEPLASYRDLAEVKKEEIDLSLYNESTDNPTWNVAVAGIPTARIQLKKQDSPEQIRSAFCSEDYAKNIMIHCEKTGFIKTMNNVRAEFWSNHTSDKEIAERFQKRAEAQFANERKTHLASFRDDYRNCINIVSAGLSKNFYPELGNALKDSLFTNLKTVGMPEQTAISAIEKSFAESASEYFDALLNKAEEYLDKHPDARKEIAAAISNSSTLKHSQEDLGNVPPATLSDRVAQASVLPAAGNLKVQKELVLDTEDYKSQLRNIMRNR